MKNIYTYERKRRINRRPGRSSFFLLMLFGFCLSLLLLSSCQNPSLRSNTQTPAANAKTASSLPKVTQIDAAGLKDLLKPNGKPLLINFWATWCGPCREEFPDLVKIGTDNKDKIDLITVSLDEPSEIDGEVSKFLVEMRSESPAYLLKTPDEGSAIALVSKDWHGGLPFTVLFNAKGETIYSIQGKFQTDVLVAQIEKLSR